MAAASAWRPAATTRRCASGSATNLATRKVSSPLAVALNMSGFPPPDQQRAQLLLLAFRGGVQRRRPHLEMRLQPLRLPQQDHLRRVVVSVQQQGAAPSSPRIQVLFHAVSPPGAASPEPWPQPAVTTPSGSLRRARPPPRSSSSPPSASQPTCPGRTHRTSTAWPGTQRSRGCWPPAATMARLPSGSTSSLKRAEGLGLHGVAVLLLQPTAVTQKDMGLSDLRLLPSAVWTPAFWRVNFVWPKSCSSSARSRGGLRERNAASPCRALNKSLLSAQSLQALLFWGGQRCNPRGWRLMGEDRPTGNRFGEGRTQWSTAPGSRCCACAAPRSCSWPGGSLCSSCQTPEPPLLPADSSLCLN